MPIRILLYLLITLYITACNNSKSSNEQSITPSPIDSFPSAEETVSPSKKKEIPRLNDSNHENFLLKYWKENSERNILITTAFGNIKLKLFEETPIHSSSFLMLVKRNYFNETMITRVVPQFVIQGGTTDLEETEMKRMVIGNYQLKPEFNQNLIHKRGVISAARNYVDNPNKLSAPYNFFIVVGRTFNHPELVILGRNHEKEFSETAIQTYQNVGGAPHLDGEHTVFGEVTSGMDVVDKISEVEADSREWPLEDIIVNMQVIE